MTKERYPNWHELSLIEQLANIGSEVSRAINWREKNNEELAMKAFFRAIELFDLTKETPRNKDRLKEVCRGKELFADYFIGENQYGYTKEAWLSYFNHFGYAVNKRKYEKNNQ